MTQKNLAERLCVSDKTVSRWERNEGTPDLTLIPAIGVEDAELDEVPLSGFKRNVINLGEISIGLTVLLIGFTLPLISVDAYWGLSADSLLIQYTPGTARRFPSMWYRC